MPIRVFASAPCGAVACHASGREGRLPPGGWSGLPGRCPCRDERGLGVRPPCGRRRGSPTTSARPLRHVYPTRRPPVPLVVIGALDGRCRVVARGEVGRLFSLAPLVSGPYYNPAWHRVIIDPGQSFVLDGPAGLGFASPFSSALSASFILSMSPRICLAASTAHSTWSFARSSCAFRCASASSASTLQPTRLVSTILPSTTATPARRAICRWRRSRSRDRVLSGRDTGGCSC